MGFKSTSSNEKSGSIVANLMKGISSTTSQNNGDIAINANDVGEINADDSDDEELYLGEIMTSPEHQEMQKNLLDQNRLRVKIIVSEICDSRGKKAFRQMFSPLLSKTKFLPELGMFHSALIVGMFYAHLNYNN